MASKNYVGVACGMLVWPVFGQAPSAVCALLTPAEIAAVSAQARGPFTAEQPGRLTPKEVPGLPTALRIEQCIAPLTAAGAVSFRLGMLTAERPLTAAQWKLAEKSLDDKEPTAPAKSVQIGKNACWQHAWRAQVGVARKEVMLNEVACAWQGGQQQLTLGFEHEDASKLPTAAAVSVLLDNATSRLTKK